MQKLVQNIVVLGAAESGVGAAILANQNNYNVFVSDAGKIKASFRDELDAYGIQWEENGHTAARILNADVIVKSPGIPETTMIMQEIRAKKIRVVSEIEFAFPFSKGKHICITGSNGKTTTTLLIHHILKKAGFDVGLAGNIGHSYAKQVALEDHEWYVLELSSFQLDDMYDFRADISIITNISPDHLDRYAYEMQNYVDAKFRILQNQRDTDWFIYNLDDPIISKEISLRNPKMQMAPFSLLQEVILGAYSINKQITINIKQPITMSIHELALKGKHNTQNALAAGIASRLVEIRKDIVRESLGDFVNAEHRMEFVAKVNGIEFINDSKATNINATWFALESMEKPVVWIVGGVDKGNDYSELISLVKGKVKAIICLGSDNKKLFAAFSDLVENIVEANSAIEAVAYGYKLAKNDEVVLLSPACASFDLFENYEDRGNQFKHAVRLL
jgi:UDP-N-acetylmuramoylalanine--D-glutamate ligase